VPHLTPETLPSALYADDCHPLTEGYQLLAKRLYANPTFQEWLR
jgi:lysophospholipase L1-like esterase